MFETFETLFWGAVLVALVYFSYTQYKARKREDFEERDN